MEGVTLTRPLIWYTESIGTASEVSDVVNSIISRAAYFGFRIRFVDLAYEYQMDRVRLEFEEVP